METIFISYERKIHAECHYIFIAFCQRMFTCPIFLTNQSLTKKSGRLSLPDEKPEIGSVEHLQVVGEFTFQISLYGFIDLSQIGYKRLDVEPAHAVECPHSHTAAN